VLSSKLWKSSALAALLCAAFDLHGDQGGSVRPAGWPGLWGPDRNASVPGPLRVVPGMQAREIWRRPVGKGISEVAVDGNRGYVTFSDGDVDHLAALDLATGKEVWQVRMDATHRGHDGSEDGPISTPVIADGRIFSLDPAGKLFAFDQAKGRELWKRDLKAELGGVAPFWGYATSPLPVGKALVVQAAGEQSNNLVALDPATGKTLWSAQPATQNGYSSPVLLKLAGVPQIVAATTDKVFGVDPETGAVLWSTASSGEPRQSPTLLPGDRLLLTAWQDATLLQVSREAGAWKVQQLWQKPVLKSSYSPSIYHDGWIYGMNGTYLVCIQPDTGEVKWREKVYNATLLRVGDYLAVLGERSGNLQIVEATPEGFRERLKIPVFNPGARSLTGPVFVDGRFLLRNVEEMVMFELTEAAPAPAAKPAAAPKGGA
jgi:outer membrane protein assembly factor BamB